jgi:c-di-GMP-binding flagellar brake protein YcgR
MAESPYAMMRSRERIKTNLKAQYIIKNREAQPLECQIIDLSTAGAAVVFPRNENIACGDILKINIFLPNTILHVSVRAEARWVRHRSKDLICGAQFQELLSENMLQQLIKKSD